MEQMTLGSLFDGIGGWQLAGVRNGIKPVWSSEIETFPLEVTKRRFPETKQLGDVTKINGADVEPVDIITSGSPCQDLSIAGERRGLDGERSGLFFDAIRIVRQMRVSTGNVYPRFYIFENVPGTLSSNQGMDFRTILESITGCEIPIPRSGRWANAGLVRSRRADVGWRIIDAQYLRSTEGNFLLPQRRRRLWIVTDFAESGRCAEKILFEQDGLSGNSQEVEKTRASSSSTVEKSIRTTNRVLNEGGNTIVKIRSGKDDGTAGKGALIGCEQSFALSCTNDQFLFQDTDKPGITYDMNENELVPKTAGTLVAGYHKCYNDDPFKRGYAVVQKIADAFREDEPRKIYDTTFDSEARETEISPTLQARMGTGGNQVPILVDDVPEIYATSKANYMLSWSKEKAQTLVATDWKDAPIIARDDKCVVGASSSHANTIARIGMCVRRLTPTECERLQSLPDGWTLIDHKSCTDSARYKALGNGMAQNVPDWILRRLVECVGD